MPEFLLVEAGARQLSSEEQKTLDTLLEIHNELGIKKAQAIAEAIRRGLLPPGNDPYWNAPPSKIDAEKDEMITRSIIVGIGGYPPKLD